MYVGVRGDEEEEKEVENEEEKEEESKTCLLSKALGYNSGYGLRGDSS